MDSNGGYLIQINTEPLKKNFKDLERLDYSCDQLSKTKLSYFKSALNPPGRKIEHHSLNSSKSNLK
jgi:hypothetical protein